MKAMENAIKYAKASHEELREALHVAKQVDGMLILQFIDELARMERRMSEYYGNWQADNRAGPVSERYKG